MRLVGSIDQWARFRLLEEQVIADQFLEALGEDASPTDGQEPTRATGGSRLGSDADLPGVANTNTRPRIAEGVDLALKFSLTPIQVHRICGDIVGQNARVKACQKFVENWLMHSSVDALNKYLEGK